MKRDLFCFLLVMVLVSVCSTLAVAEDVPEGWTFFSIKNEALTCGNYSKQEWEVKLEDEHKKKSTRYV